MENEINIIKGDELERMIESNLGELLYVLLNSFEENVIQIDAVSGEKLTADVLLKRALRIAKFLKEHNIGSGDTVSVMSENRLEFCVIPIASFFVGATFAPLNPDYTTGELKHVLQLSKPKIIFSSPQTILKLVEIKNNYPFLETLVLFGSDENNKSFIGYNTLLKGAGNDETEGFVVPSYDPKETVATILCSSGTTGLPKGVMCTHDNITAFLDIGRIFFSRMLDDVDTDKDDPVVGIIPFFHSFGFMSMIINVLRGKSMVVFNKFKPKIFLDAIVKYKIKRIVVPPPILLFLTKNPLVKKYDLSCLEEILAGAAPLSKETEMELKKRFKIKHVGQGYGMTETTLGVMSNPAERGKPGSVGVVLPGMMAKVIDENGTALGPNREGELCLKGPLIMKGYVGDVKATKLCIDDDNWLHTGDIAYYDEDRYFFIVDRLKELIKYKGFQVPPAELEFIINTHPSVMDVAVIGLPDEYAGELPLAYVVKKPGKELTSEQVQKFVADKVSPQKQLRGGVRFIKEIPRNPSGKILRRVLRNMAARPKSKL